MSYKMGVAIPYVASSASFLFNLIHRISMRMYRENKPHPMWGVGLGMFSPGTILVAGHQTC